MNLGNILIGIYDKIGQKSTPDSSVSRRILRYVNDTHREVLSNKHMARLRRSTLTFSSVAQTPYAVLPQAAVRILCIADRATNRILEEITLQELRMRDPGMTFASSIPYAYTIINYAAAVAKDPTAPASIYVQSDAALDGSGIACSLEGTITGGYYATANVSMNGLTPVNLSSTISTWEHITKFYLSGPSTGNVTITQGTPGTELARITPGQSYSRYSQIHFCGIPAVAGTYYADVELHIQDMTDAGDEPLIPIDFHDILEAGALRHEYQRRERVDQWKLEQARFDRRLAELRDFITRPSSPARGQERRRQWNNLGPYFPADNG